MADDVDLEEFVMAKDELSGADIKVRERSGLSCGGKDDKLNSHVPSSRCISLQVKKDSQVE